MAKKPDLEVMVGDHCQLLGQSLPVLSVVPPDAKALREKTAEQHQ